MFSIGAQSGQKGGDRGRREQERRIRRSICSAPSAATIRRISRANAWCVIGGGNVAMDCVRSSLRLGASEAKIVYRRRKEDMTALPEEVDGALEEGCGLMQLHAPLRIEADEDGNACRAMGAAADHRQNRRVGARAKGLRGGERAGAHRVRMWWLSLSARASRRDTLSRRACPSSAANLAALPDGMVSACCRAYSPGGDCVTGPATVIRAIAAGKVAAANIDELSRIQPPDFRGCGYSGGHFGG